MWTASGRSFFRPTKPRPEEASLRQRSIQCLGQLADELIDLVVCNDEGRCNQDMIALFDAVEEGDHVYIA